jgi:hypothetical protein
MCEEENKPTWDEWARVFISAGRFDHVRNRLGSGMTRDAPSVATLPHSESSH